MTYIQGDCLEILRDLDEGCVSAIVTDPPYGLEFMGKEWDSFARTRDYQPRTDAGYGNKGILPHYGRGGTSEQREAYRRKSNNAFQEFSFQWAVEALRVLRPGGHALIFGGTRTYHRLACAVEDAGFEIRDCLMWLYGQGFPKSLDVSKAIDKAAGVKGGVGALKRGGERLMAQAPGGERDGGGTWGDESGRDPYTYVAGSDAARLWSGYGTALKPAWEPILLARKPLVGTVEKNCREHGTGALNIDGCRIRAEGEDTGRWPANMILDEESAVMLDEQAPETGQAAPLKETGRDRPGHGRLGAMGPPVACEPHDRLGGASRFFYCAKASKRDRGEGNTHPTVKPVELMRWLVRLVKGPGDNLILDPFAGSGTTGVACKLEGIPFALIERDPAYMKIIESRLAE